MKRFYLKEKVKMLIFLILIIGVYLIPESDEWTNLIKARVAAGITAAANIVLYGSYASLDASLPPEYTCGTMFVGTILWQIVFFFILLGSVGYWISEEVRDPDNEDAGIKITVPCVVAVLIVIAIHHSTYSNPNAAINQPQEEYESELLEEEDSLDRVVTVEELVYEPAQDDRANNDTTDYE